MSYEMTGKLIEKYDTQQVTDSFKKREFVLEKSEQVNDREFVETIKFQVTQDRCSILDNYNTGDMVKVTFNIRGRRWEKEGRVNYFNNLEAWRMERPSQEGVDYAPMPSEADLPPDSNYNSNTNTSGGTMPNAGSSDSNFGGGTDQMDDLPF